jgi:hypothetical protein
MQGNVYWIVQIALIIAAVMAFRGGKFWPGLFFIALSGWTYYSHKTGTSFENIKTEINEAVDESAKRKYETGIRNEGFEYNKSKVH